MTELVLPNTIKMVITDFDGIFTDNSVYINEDGSITRKVSFKDIMGVSLLKRNGFEVCIISGEQNSAIEMIRDNLKVKEVHQKIRKKIDVLLDVLNRYGYTKDEVLYVGDDVNDVECLEYVSTKITVPNANKKVKSIENIQITECTGGDGAFREIVDGLLSL